MFAYLSAAGVIAAALIAPPGAETISALTRIDPQTLSDSAQVDLLIAWELQTRWMAAHNQQLLITVGDTVEALAHTGRQSIDSSDMPIRAAHAEIAAALLITEVTASMQLEAARILTTELPDVLSALAAGDLTTSHVKALLETTASLSADKRQWVIDTVLPAARRQTMAQFRRCLRRAILTAEPRSAATRHKQAHTKRDLRWWPLPDGMAELRLITTATDVMAVYTAADQLAKTNRHAERTTSPDDRTPIDALRADALTALATGLTPGAAVTVQVNVTIDLPTLLGLRDRPGELTGYGPLPAPLARALAADGKWRRLIHHPLTGHLLDLGHTTYQPSAALTRYIHARDQTCAFPTCNRPAINTDLDHTKPYQPNHPDGGRTDRNNLGPLCQSHHRLKHETNWTLRRDPHTSQATWTSTTGHEYPIAFADYNSHPNHDLPEDPDTWHEETPELSLGYYQTVKPRPLNNFHQLPDPIAPMDELCYDREPVDEYSLV